MIMKGYAKSSVTPYTGSHGAWNLPRYSEGQARRSQVRICGHCDRLLKNHNLEELYLCLAAVQKAIHGGRT